MTIKDKPYYKKTVDTLEWFLKYSTGIFIFYVLTDIRKGGDTRYIIPLFTFALVVFYLFVTKKYRSLRSPLFYALSGYVLISYLLLPFSFDPSLSVYSLNREILTGFFLFLALQMHVNSQKKVESVTGFFVLLLLFIVSCGYFSFLHKYFKAGILDHMYPDLEQIKFYMYHNRFAMTINLLLPFVISYAVSHKGVYRRYAISLLIILSAFAVILSLSRGGWASLIVIAVLWSIIFRRNIRKLFIPLIAGILIISSCLWFLVPSFQKRIVETTRQISTFNERTAIWTSKFSAIMSSPVVGWGYGNSIVWDGTPLVLNKHNKETLPREVKIGSHNTFLYVLFHQGIIGAVFFLNFIATGLVLIVKELKHVPDSSLTLYAIYCIFISVFIVHSFVETVPFQYICLVMGFFSGLKETHRGGYS